MVSGSKTGSPVEIQTALQDQGQEGMAYVLEMRAGNVSFQRCGRTRIWLMPVTDEHVGGPASGGKVGTEFTILRFRMRDSLPESSTSTGIAAGSHHRISIWLAMGRPGDGRDFLQVDEPPEALSEPRMCFRTRLRFPF